MRTDPHEHKHAPGMTPRSHRHVLTEVDAALAGLTGRLDALEEAMANVTLTISQLPGPVTPPVVDPVVPVTPPVDPPIVPVVITGPAYYIAPTGNDVTGNGTQTYPWKTIQKFIDSGPTAGATLYCRGGTYSEVAVANIGQAVSIQGTAVNPIVIRAYPGETPLFVGPTTGTYKQFLMISWGTKYLVIDGLHAQGFQCTEAAVCDIGETAGRTAPVSYITIRNCHFTGKATGSQAEHGIYLSEYADHITIEDNVITGPFPGQSDGLTGAGVHAFHYPAATDVLIQRNVFKGWSEGIQLWDNAGTKTLTAQLLHNTFIDCNTNIDARYHSTLLVRDNAGEDAVAGTSQNLYDPNNSASTTASYNFWDQEFDGSYYLLPGETGINAASDGKDAGALDS